MLKQNGNELQSHTGRWNHFVNTKFSKPVPWIGKSRWFLGTASRRGGGGRQSRDKEIREKLRLLCQWNI